MEPLHGKCVTLAAFPLGNTFQCGISKFRSSCLGFPSLSSQWTKLGWYSYTERLEIWPTWLNKPQRTLEEILQLPGIQWEWRWKWGCMRLGIAGMKLEYRIPTWCSTVWLLNHYELFPCHRLLSPASKDNFIPSLSHLLFMSNLLTKDRFQMIGPFPLEPRTACSF